MRWAPLLALAAALLPGPVAAAPTKGAQDFGRAVPVPGGRGTAPSVELEFTRLNRGYRDVAGALEPTQAGPFRIDLSTPRQEVTLLRHRLRLTRRSDGTHDAELRAEYRGRGRLVASASVLGFGQSFQDDVTLPGQALTLQARVRIARGRDGYLVTPVSLPAEAEVLIQSRLGGQLVGWCERLAVLPCDGLDAAFRMAVVPLPPAGRTYLLADADLTAEDRHRLDAYLGERKGESGRTH